MYLIITRNNHTTPGKEDKAIARISSTHPGNSASVVVDNLRRAVHYIPFSCPGDDAGAFNACWQALRDYDMSLDAGGRVYPTGAFDVTGFSAFWPRFEEERLQRGDMTPDVIA